MPFQLAYLAPLLSFLATFLLLLGMLKGRLARMALDHPGHRSLHSTPLPRTGGLALMLGALAGWSVLWHDSLCPVLLPGVALLVVSLLDDVFSLAIGWRFLAHFLASSVLVGFMLLPGIGLLRALLAVLAVVWMINLYNFMDGSDGLAGGMALFGFGFYGLAAGLSGNVSFALLNFALAAAAAAFLIFNFHPSKIFMGDAGSIPLGFLAAGFGITGWHQGVWPLWFPAMVFSPFIVDATVTLAKRFFRGARVWQAHREHYYQRLVQMGWGHRSTALLEYALMVSIGVSAVWSIGQRGSRQLVLILAWGAIYAILMLLVDRRWKRFTDDRTADGKFGIIL